MGWRSRWVMVAVWCTAVSAPVAAQGPRPILDLTRPGMRIRVESHGRQFEGRLLARDADSLRIADPYSRGTVAIDGIDKIWVRQSAAGKGALIGAAVVGAGFTGFLHLAISGLCDRVSGCHDDHMRAWFLGPLIGGTAGALLGAGIGALTGRWGQVYPQ